jgi:alpha-L-fucosidase
MAPNPAPLFPVAEEWHAQWQDIAFYAFSHFGMNTFTDKEWGWGDEDPNLFNPTGFNATQIV